ncbi:MAG: DUF938 domain-containing protein [Arenicellales bacterium]|nr:DUF938 domain-containing protein [Arenicellales bacterium]
MLPCAESCERNKIPILNVLKDVFATTKIVLEIGGGTGQHAVYFAKNLPHLTWQSSDQPDSLKWLALRLEKEGPDNAPAPLSIDVSDHPWGFQADGIFSANTLHIMSWHQVEQFFTGVGQSLLNPGKLCVYGPFRYDGRYTSQSNAQFEQSLKAQGQHMGIRDFEAVDKLASEQGLSLIADYSMPANNQLLVWRR